VTAAADTDRLRKRIVDLHARLGAADEPEAISARRLLANCLRDHGLTWTTLTLSIQDAFEQLALRPPDDDIFNNGCPHCQHVFGSFAPLLLALDAVVALANAHEQVGDDDQTVSATARNDIKTILQRHQLNWNDLTNLLRHSMEEVEAWQPNLLDEICDTFKEFVWFEHNSFLVTTALWGLHSQVYDRFDYTPRLAVLSVVWGSGKTTILKLLNQICRRARLRKNLSVAYLYHTMDEDHPTLLQDEAENMPWDNLDLVSMYNSGFEYPGIWGRRAGNQSHDYNVYGPLAIGFWLGGGARLPPATSMSRTIRIPAERAPPQIQETLTKFSEKKPEVMARLAALRQRIEQWAATVVLDLEPPDMPVGAGRPSDKWGPLIAIADALGRGDIARAAAKFVHKHSHDDEDLGLRALRCCRLVFELKKVDRLEQQELANGMCDLEDENWSGFRGLPGKEREPHRLTKSELRALLAPFGIWARTVWPEERTKESRSYNGYMRKWFEEKWERYCSEDQPTATQQSGIKHLKVVKS
jgi:hypothetical protein